ncbi:MAG: DUF4224 domain-containing protein [Pseudomonadota bacterium]
MSAFLSKQDLRDLTGSPQVTKQTAWLAENEYKFDIGLDGQPKVLWVQIEERQLKRPKSANSEPNYGAINGP